MLRSRDHAVTMILLLLFASAIQVFATGADEGDPEPSPVRVKGQPYIDHVYASPKTFEEQTEKVIEFAEAPMLAKRVASGELPPLEDRLPEEPQVLRPAFEIGRYGRFLRDAGTSVGSGQIVRGMQQPMAIWPPDASTFIPNVPKLWVLSDDRMAFTLHLRRGMKWSDGEPLTSDDFEFFYDDILLNTELTPNPPERYRPSGELMTMTVIDDFTVEYGFTVAYPTVTLRWAQVRIFAPKHYLKKYHTDHNPDADELAKQEGFDTWVEAFNSHWTGDMDWRRVPSDSRGSPTTDVFMLTESQPGQQIFQRNPFYWKVDTEGNQLPYVNGIRHTVFESPDGVLLTVLAGELDWPGFWFFDIGDLSVLEENEERGNYTTLLWPNQWTSTPLAVALNYTHKDRVKRELFWDIRFRKALSLAIDRRRIADGVYGGSVLPYTLPVHSHWTGFEEDMAALYSEHDVSQASGLLDEIGLTIGADGWRRMANGKRVVIEGHYWRSDERTSASIDLVKSDWAAIGIELVPMLLDFATWKASGLANELDATFADTNGGAEVLAQMHYPARLRPPWHWYSCCPTSSYPWAEWYYSGGERGDEPPSEIQELFDLSDELQQAYLNGGAESAEYEQSARDLLRANADRLYNFGTVSSPPLVVVVSQRLRNTPKDNTYAFLLGNVQPFNIDTVFISD